MSKGVALSRGRKNILKHAENLAESLKNERISRENYGLGPPGKIPLQNPMAVLNE